MQLIINCKPHNCQHHYHSIKNHLWEILVCEGEKEQGRNRRKMNCFPKYMQWLHYKICAPICMKVSSSWPPCKILDEDRCIETFRPPPNHPPFLPFTLHSPPPPPRGVSRSSWDIPTFWATEAYEQPKSEDTAVISYFKFSLLCHFTNPWWNYFFDNMESWVH